MNPALTPVKRRIWLLCAVCIVLAIALSCRFYVIQIRRHDELYQKAQNWYTASKDKMKQRGKIFDADGNLLVGNMPKIHVVCSPYSVVEEPFVHLEKSLKPGVREKLPGLRENRRRMVAFLLSKCFDKSAVEFYHALSPWREVRNADGKTVRRKRQRLVIDKAADPEAVKRFKELMKEKKLNLGGFVFENIYIRYYPKGRMLANVIGFANVGKDIHAERGGLELAVGKDLRAQGSTETFQRSGDGRALAYGESRVDVAGYDGDDIYLTVREPVQAVLEDELNRAFAETGASFVYAAIADPRTGDILAISQRPNFDPGDPGTIKSGNFANAIAGNAYEPGSVMKPFTVAKALDEGVITPQSIIDCGKTSSWYYGGHRLSDPRGYGDMPPGGVLKKSSNIGTAKIALMMGDEMVYQMFRDFRFGVKSGLPFTSESRGRLPRYPFRDKVTVTRAPIGYSVQVTALQLLRGYCAIANGGKMPELRLLDRRVSADSGEVENYPRKEAERVLKHPETFSALTEMLISVTAPDGTGRRARIPGFDVAGKTGTSQMVVNGSYSGAPYRASFCGFVPARRPELVMIITFEGLDPKKDHGGGNVAAPVFQKVMSRVLKLLNIAPDYPEQLGKEK
ncbi:MAG: penicillin-binding protein 2 [Lentisphaerae bacterium]|nr:penicillin-binding protein 2 [Lentisphaerota bacterium]